MREKLKYIVFIIIRNAVLLFLILELFFRFVIPASNPPLTEFYEKDKLIAYSTKRKDGIFTAGKTAKVRTRWHINNRGWNYPADYEKTDKKLIAIIGDSFVASNELNCDEYFPYLLRKKAYGKYEVYSFGYPNAQLAQYLQINRYVDKYFNPDIVIFNIVENDIIASIFGLSPESQFLSVSVDKDGGVKEVTPKTPSSLKLYRRFLHGSALFRYVYFNLKFNGLINGPRKKYSEDSILDNKLIEVTADYLIGKIKQENINKRIIFIIAPSGNVIYGQKAQNKKFYLFDELIKELCVKYNIEVIDLTISMREDYRLNSKKFDFGKDLHWNEYGHEFVASLLYKYLQK